MKKLVIIGTLALGAATLLPSTAHAGDCGSIASVTGDLWSKYGQYAEDNLPYVKIVDKMVKFWNSMAGNSWAKIGPRRLEYSTDLTGAVVGPTDRVFIAETPADRDKAAVTIKKLAGKAKTTITVCATDSKGRASKLWDFTVDNGKSTPTFSRTVSGVKNKILSVHLHGHSATNKFKYSLHAAKK